jgi:hypothetical protein
MTPTKPRRGPSQRLIFVIIFLAGLLTLFLGYGFHITGCKFVGFLITMVGFICLVFLVRDPKLVLRPGERPPPPPPPHVYGSATRK